MTDLSLAILLLGTFAAGICLGSSIASFAYARRYRALRSDFMHSGRSSPASERFRP